MKTEAGHRYWVLCFPELDYGGIVGFATEGEARLFARGVEHGAGYYGGGCSAYVLPGDEEQMEEELTDPDSGFSRAEYDRALAAYAHAQHQSQSAQPEPQELQEPQS